MLGHLREDVVKIVLSSLELSCKPSSLREVYGAYQMSKSHRLPLKHVYKWSSKIFDMVHVNIWGLPSIYSIDEAHYYLLFVDEFLRFFGFM